MTDSGKVQATARLDSTGGVNSSGAAPPSVPVWTNLSITGRRTTSGSVGDLNYSVTDGTGERRSAATDDDMTAALSPRARFATDPSSASNEGSKGGGDTKQKIESKTYSTMNTLAGEEDEEVQRALAMAVAIQNNPGLPPDEIRQLVAHHLQHLRKQAIAKAQQLTEMAQVTALPATGRSLSSGSENSSKRSLRDRARGLLAINTTGSGDDSGNSTATSQSFTGGTGGNRPRLAVRIGPSRSVRTPPASAAPTDTPVIPEVEPLTLSAQATQSVIGASSSSSPPIRMAGIAWKRRGGMGKYSTTSAWERRRIELQGSRLLYYLRDASEEADDAASVPAVSGGRLDASIVSTVNSSGGLSDFGKDNAAEGVVVTKRTTWFEQAVQNLAIGTEDPTEPRGYIDLIKEKATVHVAYGHSGAPSPFAISIKVRSETRWKLCFDYHRTQMEWLAALTDVIVQGSVDLYNVQLVQAADPTMQGDTTFFQPPLVHEPPASGQAAGQHRLWMTESYTVSSLSLLPTVESDDAETDDLNVELPVEEDDDNDVDAAAIADSAAIALSSSSIDEIQDIVSSPNSDLVKKDFVIPEKNLLYAAGVLNVALAYARASSTTLEGFWYLAAFANLGMYLCVTREPDWRSVLTFATTRQSVKGNADSTNLGTVKTTKHSNNSVPSTKGTSQLHTKTQESSRSAPSDLQPVNAKVVSSSSSSSSAAAFIPKAGTTTVKLDKPTDPPINSKNEMFTGWRCPPGDTLLVRSHGYLSSKMKIPSPGELYECINVDIMESPTRYPDMATRVVLPNVDFTDDDPAVGGIKTWRSPNIFIISIALPTDPPKLGRTSSDGGGFTITMYYRMKQSTRDILRQVTADGYDVSKELIDDPQKSQINAIRLFEDWCRRAPTDDKLQSRFKIVPNGHNLKEVGIPGWISQYNGKPFLIKRPGQTGFLYNHPELSCMEFDVSLHPFPYLARQAICFMKDTFFKKVLVTFGFVIEGRSDDELPECVIGAVQLCYPDPQYAIQASDFFAGTCPRSF